MEFENKTAIVTGAASGMGLLTSQCLAKEGANVLLVDINESVLAEKTADINAAHPGKAEYAVCDVREYAQVTAAADKCVAAFGRIDILINCAGGAEARIMGVKGKFHENPIEVYDFGIDVNLKGAMYFDHAAMHYMAQQMSGVIIHLGSITGEEGCGKNIAYAASKSALMNGMTKAIAKAGAEYNVRCCYVAPGPVMTRPAMANMKTLMGRAAETQEIVDLIMYLASDKASFITGSGILADCGRNVMGRK